MTRFTHSACRKVLAGSLLLGLVAWLATPGVASGTPPALTVFGHTKVASGGDVPQPSVPPLAPGFPGVRYQWAIAHPALPDQTVSNLKALKASDTGGRLQIGLGRPFDQPLVLNSNTAPASDWAVLPTGWRLWSIDVASVGALGLRLHLTSLSLPAGTRVVVYDPANASSPSASVSAQDLAGKREFWVPTVLAERVVVECQAAPGVDLSGISLAVAGVAHLYQLPVTQDTTLKAAAACENDLACFPAFGQEASAIARIGFVSGGNAFLCTGFLLADSNPGTTVNFFMTANHCVGTQDVADTLEFWWKYQDANCNGTPPGLGSVPHTAGGAVLLGAGTQSDFSLSQLRQAPPSGTFYLGWSLSAPGGSDSLTCLHHPGGSPTCISFGHEVGTDGNFWNVQWTSGVTENGSSGSPLLDANHLVIGQLMGGASSCSNPNGADSFGRFDVSYQSLQQFLVGGGPGPTNATGFLRGTYTGLFGDPNNGVTALSAGSVTLTTTAKGKFTGTFHAGPTRFAVHGGFDDTGNGAATANTLTLGTIDVGLTLDPNDSDHISGTVNAPEWSAVFDAYRNVFDARKSPAFQAGRYTLSLPGNLSATDQPNGDGYAAVVVTKAGHVTAVGALADGTHFSQSANLAPDGSWPFYVALYASQGSLFGWLSFTNTATADLAGPIAWLKPSQPGAKYFPDGFSTTINATGSSYVRPPRGATILDLTDANVTFAGGFLDQTFVNAITLDTNNRVFNQSGNSMAMIFNVGTGTFSGRAQDPSSGQFFPFSGIVIQKANTASGFFLQSGLSGEISVAPTN